MATSGDQWHSKALRDTRLAHLALEFRLLIEVIRGHQRSSEVIRGHLALEFRLPIATWQSRAIKAHLALEFRLPIATWLQLVDALGER